MIDWLIQLLTFKISIKQPETKQIIEVKKWKLLD